MFDLIAPLLVEEVNYLHDILLAELAQPRHQMLGLLIPTRHEVPQQYKVLLTECYLVTHFLAKSVIALTTYLLISPTCSISSNSLNIWM